MKTKKNLFTMRQKKNGGVLTDLNTWIGQYDLMNPLN